MENGEGSRKGYQRPLSLYVMAGLLLVNGLLMVGQRVMRSIEDKNTRHILVYGRASEHALVLWAQIVVGVATIGAVIWFLIDYNKGLVG